MKTHLTRLALAMLILMSTFTVVTRAAGAACVYHDSPMLSDLVAKGTLPSVCDRLPKNPIVIDTGSLMPANLLTLDVGKYSTQFTMAGTGVFEALREPLWTTSNLDSNLKPGIIEDFKVNDTNTEFTFKLLEGLKWSDGVAVTTKDVQFAFQDVLFNTDLTPTLPLMYRTGATSAGSPMKWSIVDDYTFTITFDAPYGGFLDQLSQNELNGYYDIIKPSHYLEQFHVKYATTADLNAKIKADNKTTWVDLFHDKDLTNWDAMLPSKIGFPVLAAWMAETNEKGKMVAVRNPYYYAVDRAGNQLPYFDRIAGVDAPEGATAQLMAMSGQVDVNTGNFTDIALLIQNQKDVYKVYRYNDNGSRGFYLNLTLGDPAWQKIVGDVRFRQAINMAIDRQEILTDAYAGTGAITMAVPTDYAPDKAKALLDAIGLDKTDSDGYRLMPNGQPFVIQVDLGPWQEYIDPVPLIAAELKTVGIKVDYKQLTPELLFQRMAANQSAGRYDWDRANTWRLRHNHDYLPNDDWGPAWRQWYESGGKQGVQPPDWIMQLYSIHQDIMKAVPNTPADQAAMDKLYAWYQANIPYFVIVDGPVYPVMLNDRIGNAMTGGFGHAFPRTWKVLYDTKAQ
ncbi:MAG: ABC transporter substrate-binding protein [Aggregatilineales bacterium]